MHKSSHSEEDEAGTRSIAGANSRLVSGPPLGPTVIPFRRASAAACPAAAGPQSADGPAASDFIPLGKAVRAVVMRLQERLPRIALAPTWEEDGRDEL